MESVKSVQIRILNALLDRYEKSKTFQGDNKVTQKISVTPEKVYPSYKDDSQYEVFAKVNDGVRDLEVRDIVSAQCLRNGVITKIILNIEQLDVAYQICGRTAKKKVHQDLQALWNQFISAITEKEISTIYQIYRQEQEERIRKNKQVSYFDGDFEEYHMLLRAIYHVLRNDSEIFIRDFSVKHFGYSKKMELMEERIRSFLYEYGDCTDRENALEEYGIVKTPTYVSVKGSGILTIGEQLIDLSKIHGDISFSSISLAEISHINILGTKVITIENLTSFHSFPMEDAFVIYLGGYHNGVKRNFLKKLYQDNPNKIYYHFGDIDAGGFYIYEHLVKRSGIRFALLSMDIATLEKYRGAWQELTLNDRKRIHALLNKEDKPYYHEVLQFMLEHNCKLEQEAIIISKL